MKSKIKIMLKESILDPQGNAVKKALENLGHKEVEDVRIGKYIEITLDIQNKELAKNKTKKMCEALLANLVIESYEFWIEP